MSCEKLSSYEELRLQNMQRNAGYLASIGLDSIKAEIAAPLAEHQKRKASSRGVRAPAKPRVVEPTRRSSRVTVGKIKAEIESMEDDSTTNTTALEEKRALLNTMIAKQQEGSYEATIAVEYEREGRLSSSPVPFISLDEEEEEEEGEVGKVGGTEKHKTKSTEKETAKKGRSGATTIRSSDNVVSALLSAACVSLTADRNVDGRISGSNTKKKTIPVSVVKDPVPTNMALQEADVAKLTPSRITSVFVHPGVGDKLLVMAGDKIGYCGLWDVNNFNLGNQGVFKFKPHVANVSKIGCWDTDPSKIYSTSYDGTVRCMDIAAGAFVETFAEDGYLFDIQFIDACFSSHASTAHCIYVGRNDGVVSAIDVRVSSRSYQLSAEVQSCKINSVQEHPTDPNLLITAGSGKEGVINIHDVRKLCAVGTGGKVCKPIVSMNMHSKSINAAYASPDGKALISVSQDQTIRTWSNFTTAEPTSTVTRHDNFTGRWLSTFRPAFDPKRPNIMVLGSMIQPRRVEVFSITANDMIFDSKKKSEPSLLALGAKRGINSHNVGTAAYDLKLEVNLSSEYLNSVCSRNCFHPSLDIVACGNSSGRVHLFR